MAWYLDSSVGVHAVLPEGDPAAIDWVEQAWRGSEPIVSSTLLRLEVLRTLRREQRPLHLADPLLDRVNLITLNEDTVTFAGRIEPHIRSMDALHLAAALLSGLVPTVITHDGTMATVANQLGLEAVDPLTR